MTTPPSEIDGEPHEVAAECFAELTRRAVELIAYAANAEPQIRNAFQTERLDDEPELPATELALAWEESDLHAGIVRFRELARIVRDAIEAAERL